MLAIADPMPVDRVAPRVVGTVESVGQLSDCEIVVTGWSHDELEPGAAILVLGGENVIEGRFWPVWSDRADVGPRAAFTGLVETRTPTARDSVKALGLPDARVLTLYREAARHDPAQSAQLLRGVLPNVSDPETRARLTGAAARYHGTDTVVMASLPVRLGIDDCVAMPGGMLLVRGWLFDPERLVTSVSVMSGTAERRVDDRWVGQARPDVTASFANDPLLGGYVDVADAHGFSAIAVGVAGDEPHIAIAFADHPPLHCPLVPRSGNPLALLQRFLHALDPQAPGSLDIVDRQIAPALAAVKVAAPTAGRVSARVTGPLSLIVGCHGDCADIPALMTILGANPAMAKVPIIVAAGDREMSIHAGQIERAARMLGVGVALVAGRDVEDRFDALALGVAASDTDHVVLMTGSLVPQSPSWLSRMLAGRQEGSVVVPQFETLDGKPASAEECCLISRQAFFGAGGFSGAFLDPSSKADIFFRQLAAIGIGRVQAPTMMTTTAASASDGWRSLARRTDIAAAAIRASAEPK